MERAERVRGVLTALAETAAEVLTRTAAALQMPEPAGAEDWNRLVREMPQLDPGPLDADLRVPLLFAFGRRVAAVRLRGALERRVGRQVAEALATHGLVLRAWANQVQAQLRQQFEAQAQVYRSHVAAATTAADLSGGERTALERDLKELSREGSPGG